MSTPVTTTLPRWRLRSPIRAPSWEVALGIALVAATIVRLTTYDAWADGPWEPYAWSAAALVAAAVLVWLVVRLQLRRGTLLRSVLPWVAAAGVLLPGDVVHYLRLRQAAVWQPEVQVAESFSGGAGAPPPAERWLLDLQPGATAVVEGGRLTLRNPVLAPGFVELRLPIRPSIKSGAFWAPVGVSTTPYDEVLEWEAQVQRDNELYRLLEVGKLILEVTPYGLHAAYVGLDGRVSGAEIQARQVNDGQPHRYRLERTDAHPLQRLFLDGQEVWARPKPGPWDYVRFGDTPPEPSHGGTLLLDNVRYTRTYRR